VKKPNSAACYCTQAVYGDECPSYGGRAPNLSGFFFRRSPDLWSGFFTTTAFSFKLSSIPGPLGQIGWKDISFIGEYQEPT